MRTFSRTALIAAPWLCVAALLLVFPAQSISAALRGIAIWWEVLFPALLTFFVITELMLGFGVVHFIGGLLDPMMRPLFRIPGYGGFVMALGFASGYPIAARLTARLREQRLVDRDEGERLVAFTTTADPIFLTGAVAVGFFHDAGLAVVLAAAHYGAAVMVGLCMRFHGVQGSQGPHGGGGRGTGLHGGGRGARVAGAGAGAAGSSAGTGGRDARVTTQAAVQATQAAGAPARAARASRAAHAPIWLRAARAMHEARLADGRPLGVLLQQSLESALKLVFMIGGLVVFFSVVLELLSVTRILPGAYAAIGTALSAAGIPPVLGQAAVDGLFEVTLGAKAAGAATVPLVHKAAVAAFIVSWAGVSVHAQISSLLTGTGCRYWPFALARLLHGLLATALVYVLWTPLAPLRLAAALPAGASISESMARAIPYSFAAGLLALLLIALLYVAYSGLAYCFRKVF